MEKKLAVIALGGNALLRGNQKGTVEEQNANTVDMLENLVFLIKEGYDLIISHGNGPQVGNVLLDNAAGAEQYGNASMPLDVCVAYTQGQIGYMIERNLRNILKILEDNDVKATFFMTGGWVEAYPEDVKAIKEAGHDLGNHSENHKQMSTLSKNECVEEIKKTHNKVKDLTGYDMFLFRPPYGDYNDTLIRTAEDEGYYCIQWDVDSLDWKDYGVEAIVQTVCEHKHLGGGSIILMHNGAKYTVDALDTIIKSLKAKGYELVPISQLIMTKDYKMDHEGRQISIGNKDLVQ